PLRHDAGGEEVVQRGLVVDVAVPVQRAADVGRVLAQWQLGGRRFLRGGEHGQMGRRGEGAHGIGSRRREQRPGGHFFVLLAGSGMMTGRSSPGGSSSYDWPPSSWPLTPTL